MAVLVRVNVVDATRQSGHAERGRHRACVLQLGLLLEHDIGENVGEGDDASHAVFVVDDHEAMNFFLDDALHEHAECLVFGTAADAVEAGAAVLEGLGDCHVEVVVGFVGC